MYTLKEQSLILVDRTKYLLNVVKAADDAEGLDKFGIQEQTDPELITIAMENVKSLLDDMISKYESYIHSINNDIRDM